MKKLHAAAPPGIVAAHSANFTLTATCNLTFANRSSSTANSSAGAA